MQNPAIPGAFIRLPSPSTRAQPSAEPWGAEVLPGGFRALLGAAHGASRALPAREAERSVSQSGDIHARRGSEMIGSMPITLLPPPGMCPLCLPALLLGLDLGVGFGGK